MNEILGTESGTLTTVEVPEAESQEEGAPQAAVYTYAELESGGHTAADYLKALTGAEGGFQVVDADQQVSDAPDFDTEQGSVSVAKQSAQEGKVLRLDIAWTAEGCTIEVSQRDGAVQYEASPMTANDAVDFLASLSPSVLGLTGSSMSAYRVYYLEGEVMVNRAPCIRLRVYSISSEQTNTFEGTYLLTADKTHLYLEDTAGKSVEELELPRYSQSA